MLFSMTRFRFLPSQQEQHFLEQILLERYKPDSTEAVVPATRPGQQKAEFLVPSGCEELLSVFFRGNEFVTFSWLWRSGMRRALTGLGCRKFRTRRHVGIAALLREESAIQGISKDNREDHGQ